MGRQAKYDWEELLKEYLASEYTSKTEFAKAKGINPSLFRRNTTDWSEKGRESKESRRIEALKPKPKTKTKKQENPKSKSNVTQKKESNVTKKQRVKKSTCQKVHEPDRPQPPNICGAKTRSGTMCKNPAGFRTPHFGQGRCYLHGGLSTGPKNGTGAHEAIWLDILPEEEQELYHLIITDKIIQLNQEIKLLDIRERRMLQRIEKLKQQDFTVVEQTTESGIEKGDDTDLFTEKKAATLGQIQAIEEALTKVQARKERLLDLKHKFEQSQGPEKPDVGAYIDALRGAAKEAWQDEKGDH